MSSMAIISSNLKSSIFILLLVWACQGKSDKEHTQQDTTQQISKNDSIISSDSVVRYSPENEQDSLIADKADKEFAKKTLESEEKKLNKDKPVKIYGKNEIKPVEEIKKEERTPLKPKKEKYDKIFPFYHGIAVVKSENKFGYINNKGYELSETKYDFAEDFAEVELARVRIKDKVGFVDKNGKEIIPLKYRYVERFNRGLAHARLIDGEKFYIDKTGNHVCDVLDSYRDGMARIKLGNKIGYVNADGVVSVPAKYAYGTHFHDGIAEVKLDDKHFFINKKGECVKDCP